MDIIYLTEAIHPILGTIVKVGDRGLVSGDGPNNATGTWDKWSDEIRITSIFQAAGTDRIYISDYETPKIGHYLSEFRPLLRVEKKRITVSTPIYATLPH